MSHFLQRLAATVAPAQSAAQPRLQPMLGSVYAPGFASNSLRLSTEAFPVAQEDLAPATQHQALTTHSNPAGASFSSPSNAAFTSNYGTMPESVQEIAQPRNHSDNWLTEAPLLPRQSPEPLAPFNSRSQQIDLPAPHTESNLKANPETQTISSVDGVEHASPSSASSQNTPSNSGRPYQPLVIPTQQVSSAPTLQPHPSAPSAAIHRAQARTLASRQAPAREPDEIHIHIGRIEVAAIQQQAPRPAPAPARHGISLDDYLRRGNGSAR